MFEKVARCVIIDLYPAARCLDEGGPMRNRVLASRVTVSRDTVLVIG